MSLAVEEAPGLGLRAALPVYALTLVLSAFLLFSVQPFFAKVILPRLGGSPAVWSVAMVFFQGMLLAGYAYAHLLTRFLGLRAAASIHALVLFLAFVALPIAIPAGWEQPPETGQSLWLLGLFAVAVGLPFFAVSANGPLLQAWFARTGHPHAADPYFLYGASNVGSFASLILYIVLIEPLSSVPQQAIMWTTGYAVLTVLILVSAWLAISGQGALPAQAIAASPANAETDTDTGADIGADTDAGRPLHWMFLGFLPSGLLVAVTAHISLDIAAAPLLWVVPLALFLLTFVVAFRRNAAIGPDTLARIVPVLGAMTLVSIYGGSILPVWARLIVQLVFFFAAALHCHAMLFSLRPPAARLTGFYLWMSLGGVLGGVFASLLAPVLFDWVAEYMLLVVVAMAVRPGMAAIMRNDGVRLVVAAAAAVAVLLALQATGLVAAARWAPSLAMLLTALAAIAALAQVFSSRLYAIVLAAFLPAAFIHAQASPDLFRERSFFGIVRVIDDGRFHRMIHGSTLHGAVETTGADGAPVAGPSVPLTYYHESGGMAAALRAMQERRGGAMARVGAVGLGTGSIICHAAPGEAWTFYEIDRIVVDAARDPALFSFMPECGPDVPVVIGDARLTLADEPDGAFDFLLIDAFSSDSVPAHLMTREAVLLYRSKLAPDGMLVFHISNRYLELESVLAAIAADVGLEIRSAVTRASDEDREQRFIFPSHVVVMAADADMFGALNQDPRWVEPAAGETRPWTDDFSNIFTALLRQLSTSEQNPASRR